MRLRRLTLTDVAGVTSAELTVPEQGVSVVHAPNETGKSTLLRAYRLLLSKTGHTGKTAEVRALQPVGRDVGSTIGAELVIGGETFEVDRTYNKQVASSLTVRGTTTITKMGKEADDLLKARFLEAVDQELYELLTFEQGRTLDPLSGAASATVMGALQQQGEGATPAGGDAVLEALRARASVSFHSKTGALIGQLKKDQQRVDDAERQRDDMAARIDALAGGETSAEASAAVERLTEELADVTARIGRAATAAKVVTARQLLDAATAQQHQRGTEITNLERLTAEEKELTEKVAATRKELAELTQEADKLERAAEGAAKDLAARLTTAAQAEANLHATLQRAEQALRAALAQEKVDAALVTRARGLMRDVELAEAGLAGGAWELSAEAGRALTLEIDGEPIELEQGGRLERAVSASLRLSEDDGTVIELRADADRRAKVERRDALAGELAQLLAGVEAADLEALEARLAVREEQEARIAELARYQDELRDDAVADELPSPEEGAGTDLDDLEAAHVAALDALAELDADGDAALTTARAALEQHQAVLAQREEEAQRGAERRKAAEVTLAEARGKRADADLEEGVLRAIADLEALGDAEGAEETEDVAVLEQERERLDGELRAARSVADRAAGGRTAIGALTTALETLRDNAKALREEFDRDVRDAEAARTLVDRLDAARADQGDRYREPLEARIRELLTRLYGFDCRVELDDDLQIVQRADAHGRMIPWAQLSGGAKEQAAVVTGLAIAELAGDGGVPFWIDDAIVFTDEERVEALMSLLNETTAQVIVLTCRRELAAGLPRAELSMGTAAE